MRQSVVQMLNYVNKHPGLALNVTLVELQGYWIEKKRSWPLLIVPRVYARTEIVERSAVQVTVIEGKTPKVDVWQEKVKPEDTERKILTEEAFWELLMQRARSQYNVVRNLIDDFGEKDGIELIPRENSIVIALRLPGTDRLASLFFVSTNAYLHVWPKPLANQLSAAGYDPTLVEAYDHQIRDILKMPEHRIELARPIATVDAGRFKSSVDELIRQIRLHESEQ